MDMNNLSEHQSPVIHGNNVTFIYAGEAKTVFVAGDYNRWELEDSMKRRKDGDVWQITKQFPENARFDYKYIVDGNWTAVTT